MQNQEENLLEISGEIDGLIEFSAHLEKLLEQGGPASYLVKAHPGEQGAEVDELLKPTIHRTLGVFADILAEKNITVRLEV